jgi:hypothetical protein
MNRPFVSILLAAGAALFVGCASQPSAPAATTTAAAPAAPAQAPVSAADEAQAEAQAASQLEKKFQDAAKGYKIVEKDGKTLYCKREKVIGSTIPTMQCLTEAQLRNQVEDMEQVRDRMRSGGRCTLGRTGGGGGACGGS